MRFFIILLAAGVLAGCGAQYRTEEARAAQPSKKARAKAGAKDFGHKVERGARRTGHKIHRFFRGDD